MLYININRAALVARSSFNHDLTFRPRPADIYDIASSVITPITPDQKG